MHAPLPLDATLDLERRDDPVLVAHGYPLGSSYFDRYWLPLVGPSVTCLTRAVLNRSGERRTIRQLAESIGIVATQPTARTVQRAIHFGLLELRPGDRLAATSHVAPLTPKQIAKLPSWIAADLTSAAR